LLFAEWGGNVDAVTLVLTRMGSAPELWRIDRHLADLEEEAEEARATIAECHKRGDLGGATNAAGRLAELEASLAAVSTYRTILGERLARERPH
jgi:hypothetical protein